jgi:phage repressor protein C with HTH and peptisase S24 domain
MDGDGQRMSKDLVKATWELPTYYLNELGLSSKGLRLFRAIGDSMTRPDCGGIHSGDVLMANTRDLNPSPPGIFALDDGFGLIVKRLEFIAYSDPPRISIRSDNTPHSSYDLPAEQVRIVGRCVWVWSRAVIRRLISPKYGGDASPVPCGEARLRGKR